MELPNLCRAISYILLQALINILLALYTIRRDSILSAFHQTVSTCAEYKRRSVLPVHERE